MKPKKTHWLVIPLLVPPLVVLALLGGAANIGREICEAVLDWTDSASDRLKP